MEWGSSISFTITLFVLEGSQAIAVLFNGFIRGEDRYWREGGKVLVKISANSQALEWAAVGGVGDRFAQV